MSEIYFSKFLDRLHRMFLLDGNFKNCIETGVRVVCTEIDYKNCIRTFNSDINQFIDFLKSFKYDNLSILWDLGISRDSYKEEYKPIIIGLLKTTFFSGIDLTSTENSIPNSQFIEFYDLANSLNMTTKVHTGEQLGAEYIKECIYDFNPRQIQHGIHIIENEEVMKLAKERDIIFNVCPTSNVILGYAQSIKEHPIKKMVDFGLKVTIATDDLLFFIAIDTLFFTVVKGLSAQEIVFLTTISSFFSIIFRIILIKLIRRIGNTNSVRLGMMLLLLSAIFITFGTNYFWIILGKIIYEVAWVFKDMENVMLKNNLSVIGKENDYAKVANKGMIVYAFLTFIVAITSGFIFNINPYLPMFLCILICVFATIIYFYMKDVSDNNITNSITTNKSKIKLPKIVWAILISYTIFFGVITAGQQNSKLLIQYELSDLYNTYSVSLYLGIIVAFSRISRLGSTIIFGKIYDKIGNKSLIILTTMLLMSFIFIILGYFVPFIYLKFAFMALGFCLILGVRDPFRLYTQDVMLKITKPEEHQVVMSYIQFARKLGATICCLIISAVLLKWEIIYVIFGIAILAFLEMVISLKLYKMIIEIKY